ncbi:hypothetical protein [Streptomyces sp. NPDC002853]
MPIDPYAALHALLRAEAVRNAPGPATAPTQTEEAEQHQRKERERPEQNHDR